MFYICIPIYVMERYLDHVKIRMEWHTALKCMYTNMINYQLSIVVIVYKPS